MLRGVHSRNFQTDILFSSSRNLTAPPRIPGFEVRLRIDPNPSLVAYGVYDNAISIIGGMALLPYDAEIPSDPEIVDPYYHEELIISRLGASGSTGGLRFKHVIQAIYEAGNALAAIPITRAGHVPRLYAGLFLQNRPIGLMKWQHERRGVAGEANSSVGLSTYINSTDSLGVLHDVNLTNALRLEDGLEPAGVGGGGRGSTGTIPFPRDSRYVLTYHILEQDVHLAQTFTAFLDAFAEAAPNDYEAVGAFVNGVGVSGDIAVNMHGTTIPSRLTWWKLIETFGTLWSKVIRNYNYYDLDWELSYEGVKIGEGFLFNISSNNLASS